MNKNKGKFDIDIDIDPDLDGEREVHQMFKDSGALQRKDYDEEIIQTDSRRKKGNIKHKGHSVVPKEIDDIDKTNNPRRAAIRNKPKQENKRKDSDIEVPLDLINSEEIKLDNRRIPVVKATSTSHVSNKMKTEARHHPSKVKESPSFKEQSLTDLDDDQIEETKNPRSKPSGQSNSKSLPLKLQCISPSSPSTAISKDVFNEEVVNATKKGCLIDISDINITKIASSKKTRNIMQAVYWGRKVILKEFYIEEGDKDMCINEAQFYFQNQFLNLVNFIGVYTSWYPIVYIVYEFYTTITLGDLIKKKKFEMMKPQEIAILTLQLTSCIDYLNKNGYTLTCIDPDNVLMLRSQFDDTSEIKLCGFSNIIKFDVEAEPIKISNEYLEKFDCIKLFSPETIKDGTINSTSIVFSIGVIMIMMLSNEIFLPKVGNFEYLKSVLTEVGIYKQIWEYESTHLNMEFFPNISYFITLISRCCSLNSRKRPNIKRLNEFLMKKI